MQKKKERKNKIMNKVGTRWKVKERKSFYQCLKKAKKIKIRTTNSLKSNKFKELL